MRTYSALLALSTITAQSLLAAPPVSERAAVVDTYHGVNVTDEYRWLEDWGAPKVKAWSEAQNVHARAVLDAIACAAAVRARVTEIENSASVTYDHVAYANGVYFASKNQPPKQQPMIVVLKGVNDLSSERVLLDPNALDASGGTAYDWFVPSPDGRLLAVSLSAGGSESGDVHVYDVASGKEMAGDTVKRVNGGTAGGCIAWMPDGSGFYYTRYPRAGERPSEDMDFWTQLYFHKLGTDAKADRYEVGKDYPKIAEIMAEVSPDGTWALTNVQKGDGGEFIQDLRSPDGAWTRLSRWEDGIVEAKFGHDSAVYLVSRKDAPKGKLLRLALGAGKPSLAEARVIVPEQVLSIDTDFSIRGGLWTTQTNVLMLYQNGGPNELRAFDMVGKAAGVVPSLEISTVDGVTAGRGDEILFRNQSYISPQAWYTYSIESHAVAKTAMFRTSPVDLSGLEVVREFATSKDGTSVPISIVRSKGLGAALTARKDGKPAVKKVAGEAGDQFSISDAKINGVDIAAGERPAGLESDMSFDGEDEHGRRLRWQLPAPTVLWGYGGYGINEAPTFSSRSLVFLEQGGVYAVANIRGGGEFGEEWHKQGNLTNKQNVFDDFYAAGKYLIESGYTTREKLAVMGGSNGGLLMGATLTQHPDLCKAVVSSVGMYDMLRVELSSNGAFNVTEFGTVTDPRQFKALMAYSPYHHVNDGTAYPATLFMTGANDPRVDPMQSRKMTARLQAANPGGVVLLRTSSNTGHGMGSPLSERIEQTVDTYSFLFSQLGVDYKPTATSGATR